MASNYAVGITNGAVTAAACFCGIDQTVASPLRRGRVFELEFGSSITPADNASRVLLQRMSTALPTGGNTSIAGVALDPADPASQILGFTANTGGATLVSTGIVLQVGINMRATFRWVAAPGKEPVIAATQYAGIGIVVSSQTTAYNPDATLMWEE